MHVVRTIAELRAWRRGAAGPVGLVPTMGALHTGHLSLVEAARADCVTVSASIFVNPAQFGPGEDLARYPRDEQADLARLEAAGTDLVFVPGVESIYPEGFSTNVRVGRVSEPLEGAHRPGHFDGVATVVAKLLNLVQPDRAYFGQKDAQQLAVIQRLVADLDIPIAVVACPTVRDPDGLALSSRNVYLDADARRQALSLSQGLARAVEAYRDGERDAEALRGLVLATIEAQPLAEIDYVAVVDPATFEDLDGSIADTALALVAVRFGGTRLIDNARLDA